LASYGAVIVIHIVLFCVFFFSSRRRHTRFSRDWSSDVCSSDLNFPNLPKRTSSISKIWAIGFGQAGVTLAILSMFISDFYNNILKKYIATIGYFIGVFIVVLSASKGPFLTLVLLTILYFLLKGKRASLNFYWFYILLLLFLIWII